MQFESGSDDDNDRRYDYGTGVQYVVQLLTLLFMTLYSPQFLLMVQVITIYYLSHAGIQRSP